jgi:hypothetical protein
MYTAVKSSQPQRMHPPLHQPLMLLLLLLLLQHEDTQGSELTRSAPTSTSVPNAITAPTDSVQ